MLDSMDIHRGIREVLEANFPEITIQTKDIKTPTPPCFYIKSVADNNEKTAMDFVTTKFLFSVVYFSEQETQEDLLTVKEQFKRLFLKPLKVTAYNNSSDENYIEINRCNITLDEDNYFFNGTIELEITQRLDYQDENSDSTNNAVMENMVLRLTKGG